MVPKLTTPFVSGKMSPCSLTFHLPDKSDRSVIFVGILLVIACISLCNTFTCSVILPMIKLPEYSEKDEKALRDLSVDFENISEKNQKINEN